MLHDLEFVNATPRQRDAWLHKTVFGMVEGITPSLPRYSTCVHDCCLLVEYINRNWSGQKKAVLNRLMSEELMIGHGYRPVNPFTVVLTFLQDPSFVAKAVWLAMKEFNADTIRDSQEEMDQLPAMSAERA